jgi:hypothetical protein
MRAGSPRYWDRGLQQAIHSALRRFKAADKTAAFAYQLTGLMLATILFNASALALVPSGDPQ